MSILFKNSNDDGYSVANVTCYQDNSSYKVKWTMMKADGFIVVAVNALNDVSSIQTCLNNFFPEFSGLKVERKETEDVIFISILKNKFSANGVEICKKKDMKTPLKVYVFAYSIDGDDVIIYEQKEKNYDILQYQINYIVKYIGGLFNFNNKTIVKIPYFCNCEKNILYYTISGSKVKYPVTNEMYDVDFEIQKAKANMFSLKIEEQYKELFKCIRKEGDR